MQCGHIGMYRVKCKKSISPICLTTLCSHFLLSYSNQAMTKYTHWWRWLCDLHAWGICVWGELFSYKNTTEGCTHNQFKKVMQQR